MIVLTDIGKQYGRVRANDSISLTLEPGRIYALVGENGAGKSTLMRILAGHTETVGGMRLRAVGESPRAAFGRGIRVRLTRLAALGQDFDPRKGL